MLDTPLNPGFEEVGETDYFAIYRDDKMLDFMTEAEALSIATEFRNLWPTAPRHMDMQTASFNPQRQQTTHRITPEGIPIRIARCQRHGEEPVLLRFDFNSLYSMEIIKGHDDWWWVFTLAMPDYKTPSYSYFKCDQLKGLFSLMSYLAW
jgi:hypothetical protein